MLLVKKDTPSCWILSLPRTGSSWLQDILNNSSVFQGELYPFYEWLNYGAQIRNRTNPWKEWAVNRIYNHEPLPKLLKIHYHDFKDFSDTLTLGKGRKYIRLRRRDMIATTVSHYLALSTRIFVPSYKDQKERYLVKVAVDKTKLLREYQQLIDWERAWSLAMPQDHLEVYYEDLNTEVFQKIFRYLGFNLSLKTVAAIPTYHRKIEHPQRAELYETLASALY